MTIFIHFDQAQGVGREITNSVNDDLHAVRLFLVFWLAHPHFDDPNVADASSTADTHVGCCEVIGCFVYNRCPVHEMNLQYPLIVLADFYVVNAVQVNLALISMCSYIMASLCIVTTDLGYFHRYTVRVNCATLRSFVRRTTYWIRMLSVDSSLVTSNACSSIKSPSQRCNVACSVNFKAAASSGLLGPKIRRCRPLPKSGRLTRSPGLVKSSCSIISRMWSSSLAEAVRPRLSRWNGKSMFITSPLRASV